MASRSGRRRASSTDRRSTDRARCASWARRPARSQAIHLRVGQLDLAALDIHESTFPEHLLLAGQGIGVSDPEALPLVHRKPASLSSWNVVTLSGELLNTGKEPTPPIEVSAVATSGYGSERKRVKVAKSLGVIAPGGSAKYSLTLTDFNYGEPLHATFRADGKRLSTFNEYSYEHSLHALAAALDLRARHGVWVEHGERRDEELVFVVRLAAEQTTLADGPREALFHTVAAALGEHQRKYHKDSSSGMRLLFAAPGGGGWRLDLGKKTVRYEGSVKKQMKERF